MPAALVSSSGLGKGPILDRLHVPVRGLGTFSVEQLHAPHENGPYLSGIETSHSSRGNSPS